MARPPLESLLSDPGYTPRVRDVEALVELLADDDLTSDAERAIARVGAPALGALRRRLHEARPPLRARIVRTIGRLADHAEARGALLDALRDADAKTRRNAAIALGHVRVELETERVEEALLAAWEREERVEMRRSIAASLGKVGTTSSLPYLRAALRAGDSELTRIAERALMMIERTASRPVRGHLDPHGKPDRPLEVIALCRSGIESLLAEELSGGAMPHSGREGALRDVRVTAPGCVSATMCSAMGELFRARTMLSFCFPLPAERARASEAVDETVARAVNGERAKSIFAAWTVGAVRYRIAWAEGGHKRAQTWALARSLGQQAPELVNDPTSSMWELNVDATPSRVAVTLAPRGLPDPRFLWRKRDVPASSHPTLAAALARVAEARPDDVVWDPFVGSGAELVERGLLGPHRSLMGSDTEPLALEAARENLAAAGIEARLEQADALVHAPAGVTLIITNPPMGRRASRTAGLSETLDRFVLHAASVLLPGGRLVWMSPWPKRTRTAALRAGLKLEWAQVVDMGGFDAEMQRWSRS
ncbi:MAG: HEAT repeat domain-containing protein [Myxococcota bacterium]|nr:HEAT repeat domain-containing protein [Myxococcota bacterium]